MFLPFGCCEECCCEHVCTCTFFEVLFSILLGIYLRVEFLGRTVLPCGICRGATKLFWGCTISRSHQLSMRVLTSHTTRVISHFWIIAMLVGMKCYLMILFSGMAQRKMVWGSEWSTFLKKGFAVLISHSQCCLSLGRVYEFSPQRFWKAVCLFPPPLLPHPSRAGISEASGPPIPPQPVVLCLGLPLEHQGGFCTLHRAFLGSGFLCLRTKPSPTTTNTGLGLIPAFVPWAASLLHKEQTLVLSLGSTMLWREPWPPALPYPEPLLPHSP